MKKPSRYGERIATGPATTARLCHLVVLVPGVGQLWHTFRGTYVLRTLDVRGAEVWSVVEDVKRFLQHYDLRVSRKALGPSADELNLMFTEED